MESYREHEPVSSSTATDEPVANHPYLHRRRHSYHAARRRSLETDPDAIYLKVFPLFRQKYKTEQSPNNDQVELFLSELERRLEWLESYRQEQILQIDARLKRSFAALQEVRDACSHASGELMGAGRQRAKILVETLESRYHEHIPTKESLELQARAGMKLMEKYLVELESRANAVREGGFSGAIDEGWKAVDTVHKAVDESIERAKQSLRESIDNALDLAGKHGLIHYKDLPHPWRVNPYITKGYRFTTSKMECLTSMFLPSNELVNIWSHLIGLIVILAIAFYFYPLHPSFSLHTKMDIVISGIFFFAAAKCLVCSTIWHTMNSISNQSLMERFACVDYTGISLLVAASIVTTEYTAFYCDPLSQTIYITSTAILGILGVILPWHPTFNRADMAWARVAFYVTLAATGFAPIFQLSYTHGFAWTSEFYAPISKSVGVYLLGAVIYASHIPERWCPGLFDYVGGSHNIWHVAVLGGILFHYGAMLEFFQGAFVRARAEGGCVAV